MTINNNPAKNSPAQFSPIGMGIILGSGIGIAAGVVIGTINNNAVQGVMLGTPIGIGIGIVIGLILHASNQGK